MQTYWSKRFAQEGMIWGTQPSQTAEMALKLFQQHQVKRLLIPGIGYGRNSKLFTETGMEVDGIELSSEAVELARNWNPEARVFHGSILDMPFSEDLYDGIYCYDVIHLFLENDRKQLIDNCIRQLKAGGVLYFTCFSELDRDFGIGKEIERNTYEVKQDKVVHFFTEEELFNSFKELSIQESGIVEDILTYGDGSSKSYSLRYLFAMKK